MRKAREARRAHLDSTRRVHEAGVPVALGTDFIGPDLVPHGENALEAELLVSAVGLSEMEAIRAATSVAARTVPGDEIGAIEAGRYGDLVALGSDPLDDIEALRDVEAVYRGGEVVWGRSIAHTCGFEDHHPDGVNRPCGPQSNARSRLSRIESRL
ncbi:amidohydrolase family protein [Halomarina halobia]|uniref:Amidohydrolase family protein n=1 Tax=Halomarina halobia TaxID=3033386 RepID=A0ABD6A8S6_9EURY